MSHISVDQSGINKVGGVSSHLHSALCPQVKSRGQELSVIPRENAQSSCCTAPGLSPVQQQFTTMQPKRVPKLKMFYVIYPVTSLWRVPGFPSPLLPSSLSLVLRRVPPFSLPPFRTAERLEVGRTSDRSGAGGSGAEGDVSGRAAPWPVQVLPLAGYLQVKRWRVEPRTSTSPKWLVCVISRQSNWFQGIFFFLFFFLAESWLYALWWRNKTQQIRLKTGMSLQRRHGRKSTAAHHSCSQRR